MNRYPQLKNIFYNFINTGYYENIIVEFIPGAVPTAYFYDENQVETDSAVLSEMNIEELKALLAQHGFELRRPTLPEPVLTSELYEGGVHYQYFGEGKLYQQSAQEFAEKLNYEGQKGRLLTLRCKSLEEKIDAWIKPFNPEAVVWLGASDRESEGYWKWTNGDLFWTHSYNSNGVDLHAYTNWREGEPNHADGNENCASYKPQSGWNDVNCDSAAQIVVEFGPVNSNICENEQRVLESVQMGSHDHEVNL